MDTNEARKTGKNDLINQLGSDSAIVGEIEGFVVAGCLGEANIGANELSDFRSELEEDVSPATSVLRSEDFGLLFVHLEIRGEDRLAREDPSPAPVPPLSDRATGEISDRGHGFGFSDRPCGCRGGDWLDSEGERGEAAAEGLLGGGVGVGDWEGVGERP